MAGRIARAHPRLLVLLAFTLLGFFWLVSHAPKAHAQLAGPAGQAIADAQGGDSGDVRGGDGGRGGDGILGSCSQNASDDDGLATLDCGLGGRGGDGGDAGVSTGGNGGIAFAIGGQQQPSTPGLADLAATKTAPATVNNCGLACAVTQTVTVTNIGAQTAANVSVSDNSSLVAQSGFIVSETATPSQGSCSPVVANHTTCSLGNLAPGQSATIALHYTLHIDVGPGILSDTATASTTSPEVTTANNTATASTTGN